MEAHGRRTPLQQAQTHASALFMHVIVRHGGAPPTLSAHCAAACAGAGASRAHRTRARRKNQENRIFGIGGRQAGGDKHRPESARLALYGSSFR